MRQLLNSERHHNEFLRGQITKLDNELYQSNEAYNELADEHTLNLTRLADTEKSVGVLEGRVSQLESENVRLTRMLEDSVYREREVSDRLQKRLGLLRDSETVPVENIPRAVRGAQVPWSRRQAKLEADDREQHYREVIAKVEERDKDRNSSGDVGVGRESTEGGVVGEGEPPNEISGDLPDNALSTGSAV